VSYQLLLGDCIETMRGLEGGTVQTCVTSPPYYGLRDYGHEGQIGLEETPEAYVAKLVDVFREVRRLLKDDGTLWLNLGDSYNGSGGAGGDYGVGGLKEGQPKYPGRRVDGLKPKDLIGIPWMVAFALRADGWYLRQDIIWHKPNQMPESVKDRCTKAHEYIFLLSKSSKYFYDADAIAEKANQPVGVAQLTGQIKRGHLQSLDSSTLGTNQGATTRNRRSVWTVTTKPYSGAHFAIFPPDLIEPCILAGTSKKGCCAKCGAVWVRVTEPGERVQAHWKGTTQDKAKEAKGKHGATSVIETGSYQTYTTVGWQPTCTCNADIVPCTVLDPFNGSGTTGAVALKHGRKYIGCELNPAYIELAHERIRQSQPMLLTA